MSSKILVKVSVLVLSLFVLSGCNILTDLFKKDSKQEQHVVTQQKAEEKPVADTKNNRKNNKKKNQKNSKAGKKQAKDSGESVIVEKKEEQASSDSDNVLTEDDESETIDEKPTVSSKATSGNTCVGNERNIQEGFSELAEAAGYSFQPRQPNLVMVTGITVGKGVCKGATSYSGIVKHNLAATGRFTLIGNDVNQRIMKAASGTSYAYLVRVAKAQNVDYIVSGAAIKNGSKINLILKITDIKSGATVWQKNSTL
ncbi:hypothetical protein [uncultured Ruminobacter sp.]|uniref:hypothetical protein n=1 Tax=uncultured Ruminobacter sp. TaxID=538947 RepID=UPI0025FC0756|nr:hypothetical protein [uncultured Ruminobacter sp.]